MKIKSICIWIKQQKEIAVLTSDLCRNSTEGCVELLRQTPEEIMMRISPNISFASCFWTFKTWRESTTVMMLREVLFSDQPNSLLHLVKLSDAMLPGLTRSGGFKAPSEGSAEWPDMSIHHMALSGSWHYCLLAGGQFDWLDEWMLMNEILTTFAPVTIP